MSKRLNRRAFLAGAGGTAMALPFLEAMEPSRSAKAQGGSIPKRYVVIYGGTSVAASATVPGETGTGYTLTRGLMPLAGRQYADLVPDDIDYNTKLARSLNYDSVVDQFSVVSGLEIPWADSAGPGGREREFHGSTVGPTLSGVRCPGRSYDAFGESSDQIVKRAIAGDTRFQSLEYRAQVKSYRGSTGTGDRSRMSWSESDGRVVANDPIVSPRVAYDQLFRGFTPEDPTEALRRQALLQKDSSVLDLVSGGTERLMDRLGRSDRQRMQRYFDQVRDLENSINDIPSDMGPTCHLLPDPGEDPAVRIRPCTEDPGNSCEYAFIDGWADEDRRARAMCDMIHMAFACDMTRSATLMLTFGQSFLNMRESMDINADVHELGHGANGNSELGTADAHAWHLAHVAYLVDKLRNTPEGSGTMLDNTVVLFMNEGGYGPDPESGGNSTHSSENMVAMVAGGGLGNGRHVATGGAHPAQVLISGMQAVGVETNTLGEVTGACPGL